VRRRGKYILNDFLKYVISQERCFLIFYSKYCLHTDNNCIRFMNYDSTSHKSTENNCEAKLTSTRKASTGKQNKIEYISARKMDSMLML
jgi:hypothetical protein